MNTASSTLIRLHIIALLLLLPATSAWCWNAGSCDLTGSAVPAYNGTTCPGTRAGSSLNCTAKEFTVSTTFSAAPGTDPICFNGSTFEFQVDMELSGSNANRYEILFYSGEDNNSPAASSTSTCSGTAFPLSIASAACASGVGTNAWANIDAYNQCADYYSGGDNVVRVNKISAKCVPDANGYLAVPYLLAYEQNAAKSPNPICYATTPSSYPIPTTSKCQTGTSTVSGAVQVFSGAYVNITKQTVPAGDPQSFTFNASGPTGSKIIVKKGTTFTPTLATNATNTLNGTTLAHGETASFLINALSTGQQLTLAETANPFWEPTASISCTNVTGTPINTTAPNPNPNPNNSTRTIVANLSSTNSAATCTVTNYKRSKITMVKDVQGRANSSDGFTVTAAVGGGTVTDNTGLSITSPVNMNVASSDATKSYIFWSTPGQLISFSETATNNNLSDYVSSYSCTNALSGSPTSMPSGNGTSFSFTPTYGDDITCTVTNSAKAVLTKSFSPSAIDRGDTSTLTFTINNLAGAPAYTGLAFSDTLPGTGGITATTTTPQCGGTVTVSGANNNVIALNGGSIAAGASTCTITATVSGSTAGTYINGPTNSSISGLSSNLKSNADHTLTVRAKPILTKAFNATDIGVGQTATLTFTINNNVTNAINRTGLTFTDTLPGSGGITAAVSSPQCGGTVTVSGASNNIIALSGGSVNAGASCTITATITGVTAGTYTNGNSSISGVSSNLVNSVSDQTLYVRQASLNKAFSPIVINRGETSTLTFTITNGTNSPAQSGINFTDTMPANVTVASTPNISSNCPAGGAFSSNPSFVTAAAGSGTITVTNAAMNSTVGSCQISVDVTSSTAGGPYNNTSGNISGTARITTSSVTPSGLSVRAKVTLRKTWANAIVNDAVNVTATGLTTLASVANTANETDAGSAEDVLYGTVITLGESFTTGSSANYTTALACTGTSGLSGNTLTIANSDSDIVCTYTNTRKTATLTLQKTWVNALSNDAVNVTASGLTTLASVANTASETDAGSSQTVRAGDVITLGETFTNGSAINYTVSLACSGTSGLSGNTLTVGSGDTAITCTYTNTGEGLPLITVVKSADLGSARPGQLITYTVQVNNSGGKATLVNLTDSFSPYAALRVRYNNTGSTPFNFIANSSGLSLVPGAVISYSSNNGTDYNHTLTDQGDGYDSRVTNWKIDFSGSMNGGNSNFILNYQLKVK